MFIDIYVHMLIRLYAFSHQCTCGHAVCVHDSLNVSGHTFKLVRVRVRVFMCVCLGVHAL